MPPKKTESSDTGFRAGHFYEKGKYGTQRPRGTRDWLLIYTVSGHGLFSHPSKTIQTDSGDAVLIPPGVLHDYGVVDTTTPWELLWAHFIPKSDWLTVLDWPELASKVRYVSVSSANTRRRVESALKNMVQHWLSHGPDYRLFAHNALEEALLWINTHNPRTHPLVLDDRIQHILHYIAEHFRQTLTIESLAGEVSLSPSRFIHLFKESTGLSTMEYIEQLRIAQASELLERTQRPIRSIAHHVGFEDPLYFSKRFKKHKNMSPLKYRSQFQK